MFACAAFFISFLFIQPGISSGDEPTFIQEHDTDGDGKVSREEFKGSRDAFNRYDKDRDGYIDKKEAPKR